MVCAGETGKDSCQVNNTVERIFIPYAQSSYLIISLSQYSYLKEPLANDMTVESFSKTILVGPEGEGEARGGGVVPFLWWRVSLGCLDPPAPIQQNGRKSRKFYAVPIKRTKPLDSGQFNINPICNSKT